MKKLLLVTCFSLIAIANAFSGNYYIVNVDPWGNIENKTAMDNVFGSGNWTQANFNVDAATVFVPENTFAMLEGSDQNAIALNTFMQANMTVIENWVAQGGRLFINAAPNGGGNIACGFGDVIINYPISSSDAIAFDVNNPIFNGPYLPIATAYTGSGFAHAGITGTGLDSLLVSSTNTIVLADMVYGKGIVFFGTMTSCAFHSPSAESYNLLYNIFSSVQNIVIPEDCKPVFTLQPTDINTCQGNEVLFSVSTSTADVTYQWQEDTGSGFTNIIDGSPYSDVLTPTLKITNAPIELNNINYRCVLTNTTCTGINFSHVVKLSVKPSVTIAPTASLNEINIGEQIELNANSVLPQAISIYHIKLADLINVVDYCGNNKPFGDGNIGFKWVDSNPGAVVSVSIKFVQSHESGTIGSIRTTTLNGETTPSYTTTVSSGCNPTEFPIIEIIPEITSYLAGGTNTFLITNADETGFAKDQGLDADYAVVTVTYDNSAIYKWTPGDIADENTIVTPTEDITYSLTATSGNGCSNTATVDVVVINSASVKEMKQGEVSLFPSPATSAITISGIANLTNSSNIKISDVSGKIVMVEPIDASASSLTIDITSLVSGIYFISIETSNSTIVKRFVKL